jgi:hypothetical protein
MPGAGGPGGFDGLGDSTMSGNARSSGDGAWCRSATSSVSAEIPIARNADMLEPRVNRVDDAGMVAGDGRRRSDSASRATSGTTRRKP